MLWLVNTYDIDLIIASPQQALTLAEIQEKVTRFPLAGLKTLRLGGAVIAREGIERIRNHLCRNIVIAYSSTEAGTVATAPFDMIAHIPGAVGFVIPEAEVEIVDATDQVLPIGSEGFVRLRSKQFVLNFGVENLNTWFYPGDFGWLTDGGVLCIAGRKGDVVNRGGVKLSVPDLENFLLSCPGVTDAGVCTLMGASGYEEVWVALVFAPTMDMAELRQKIEFKRGIRPQHRPAVRRRGYSARSVGQDPARAAEGNAREYQPRLDFTDTDLISTDGTGCGRTKPTLTPRHAEAERAKRRYPHALGLTAFVTSSRRTRRSIFPSHCAEAHRPEET